MSEARIEKLMENMAKELEKMHNTASAIKRDGLQIVIPEHMTVPDVITALDRWNKSMETVTEKVIEIKGHESDMLNAFYNGMKKTFGNLAGDSQVVNTFFGSFVKPGQSKSIEVDYGKQITVPYGKVTVPGLPIEIIVSSKTCGSNVMDSKLHIYCNFKKKYEPLVEILEKAVREEMKSQSIFKGKAIDSRFNFVNLKGFPLDKIVYSKDERTQLQANILRLIKNTEDMKNLKVSLKRTILLHGKYGTGKTLTALLCGNICVENGWTFINVLPGDPIEAAVEVAKRYEPSLVFFEDIDAVTSGGRDSNVNKILNTVDGLLSKSARVMTILTTNHVEMIEKAMLRPGRIDAVIEMGCLTADAVRDLVEVYCGASMAEEVDKDSLWSVAHEYTPSFIAEACQRATLYALERVEGNIKAIAITNADIVDALKGLRSQFNLMVGERVKEEATIDKAFRGMMEKTVTEKLSDKAVIHGVVLGPHKVVEAKHLAGNVVVPSN